MSVPQIKGWCPGAHRPMMSGDGLVVRVRPFLGQIDRSQATGLCDLALRFGNGILDLTSRANLQIRGVAETDHHELLKQLDMLGLIDADPNIEGHRNVLIPPFWSEKDLTHRLYSALLRTLPLLPQLPQKMGFALDTCETACLGNGSADFRFELDSKGDLLLRADGSSLACPVTEENAMSMLVQLAHWFVSSGGTDAGRMARHLKSASLPHDWTKVPPRTDKGTPAIGSSGNGTILGAPFGKIAAADLKLLLQDSRINELRLMLDRQFFLPSATVKSPHGFVAKPSGIMQAHACPGAPLCPQATVKTLEIAKRLAEKTKETLHVSGCAKGCAFPKRAKTTLVGNDGRFDLVSDGFPWDAPGHRGLTPDQINELSDPI